MIASGDRVRFQVGERACTGHRGESLLDALGRAGFEVPSLCHLPGLSPYGACRLCLVEIEKGNRRSLITSCNYPVLDGIRVLLDTEKVQRHRRMVLELLLSMAPDSSRLRALARQYGVVETRLAGRTSADGCILCGLCVRVCREAVRAGALGMAGRGATKTLARRPFGEFPDDCIGCGACAFVCPTGAVSMEPEAVARLRARWGEERPCRYSLMGLAPGSVCENDYQCRRCEVDQGMVDRAGGRHPAFLLPGA